MRIPINWLKEYVDFKLTTGELSDKLTMSGTENEILSEATAIDPNVIVAEILEIKPHPNADKLRVVRVRISDKEEKEIVCGAANIEAGQKVPLALPGAKFGEFEIEETEIRGVKSPGMLCSEKELGISDHAEGIMILEPDSPVGESLANILRGGKNVLEAEITPNRGDCLSIIGVAREVAAVTGKRIKDLEFRIKESKERAEDFLNIKVEEKELCPRYVARVVKIKNNGKSPKWMQERLIESGIRPISMVVDVTNYVMLEMGQPLHAFDFDKLTVNSKQKTEIIVRRAKDNEIIKTLDGIERKLTKDDLVIADLKQAIAVAGVMGGANTEVDENTKMVILESAAFDKVSVRKTAQKLNLRSEASNRFEKGIPISLNEMAIDRAAWLLAEIAGGEVMSGRLDVLSKWIWVQHIGFRISNFEKFLGERVEEKRIVEILKSLGFEAEKFDIKKEAKKHLGKPYIYGASFRTHGTNAFDCSYFTDYIYSLIGLNIGHTALDQFENGKEVKEKDLKPGDLLFYIGHNPRKSKKYPKGVGHVGLYIGGGEIVDSVKFEYDEKTKTYKEKGHQAVHEQPVEIFMENPEFLGARRYYDDLDDFIAVAVPWWRLDVTLEEDLYEEVTRIYGYNKVKSTLPIGELPKPKDLEKLSLVKKIREVLKGIGFAETYNYSFIGEDSFKALDLDLKDAVKIQNPIAKDLEYMRTLLLPSLLLDIQKNQGNFEAIKIFEIAQIYLSKGKIDSLPEEIPHLAGAILGGESPGINYKEGKEFYQIKGAIQNIAKEILDKIDFVPGTNKNLHPFRSADLLIKGKKIGFIGEVKPDILRKFDIKKRTAIFEIDLSTILEIVGKEKRFVPFSRYPSISRDLAFVIGKNVQVKDILSVVDPKSDLVQNISIKDIYFGKEMGENKKSVLINIIYQGKDRTLEEKEIENIEKKVIENVSQKLQGTLRD
ncbi:MAG: phenylalanine--tRNA ligase subunit beta [Patescibacteria group bacterium]|nr:phenylalanine--tRNA ligase subunit beta [Patescibacteria group bacterium]